MRVACVLLLVVLALCLAPEAVLAQGPIETPTPAPTPEPGPSAGAIGGAVSGALLGGLSSLLPSLISQGATRFLGDLGHFVYEAMGGFFRGTNIVTRFPPAWTVDNPVVLSLWDGVRWLANGLLGLTLVGALWDARDRDDEHPATLPLEAVKRVAFGAVAINGSMEIARPVLALFDSVYLWVASAPLERLLPGWQGAAAADRQTAEGVGLLLYAAAGVLLFLHSLGGLFFFDALLVLMPLCLWCGTVPLHDVEHWFRLWCRAIGGALGAKLMLGVVLRLALAFVESGLVQSSWAAVDATLLSLLFGGAGLLVALKVASMGHAGVAMFHPFASAGRAARGGRAAVGGAARAVASPFTGGGVGHRAAPSTPPSR